MFRSITVPVWFFLLILSFISPIAVSASPTPGVVHVAANKNEITIHIDDTKQPLDIVELFPNESTFTAPKKTPVFKAKSKVPNTITIPRFDGDRDRIYSAFVGVRNGTHVGKKQFVAEWKDVSESNVPFPKATSKKGLQVQMVEDAIALKVKHAALNLNFGNIITLSPTTNDLPWKMDGRTFHFYRPSVEQFDERVKRLSDAGMTVTLILLYYKSGNVALNDIMLHPKYDLAAPNHLSAFNTSTPEGLQWFKACVEFIAHRYSQKDARFGRVVNFIVGNEVNSHWHWANMGRVSMEDFTRDYLRTVRVCHTAVRKFTSTGRVYLSLEHHWNKRYPDGDENQTFAAKPFLHHFAMLARTYGDFDWHLAFHPYPENLFEPRTWQDKSAWPTFDTPRITFKNVELLPLYLEKEEFLYHGKPRRIILSEQGFHSDGTEPGEMAQAAAYCYAYYKIDRIKGIDSFILHRHVDNSAEGGLNLGLWRRADKSYAEPASRKPIYDAFEKADTKEWRSAFAFALPIIGIKDWSALDSRLKKNPEDK